MVGFGAKNSVARGMLNEQAQLSSLLIVLNGWPLFIGLGLVLLPFMLGSRSRWDFFLLLAAVFAMGVWTAFEASGLMYGPRYWYEAVPFLMLLAARGLTLLQDRVAHWAHLIGRRAGFGGSPVATSGVLTYGLLLVLLGISVHGWMLGKHFDTPPNDYAPRTISELKGFNGANDRLLRQIDDMDLHNALILVKSCPTGSATVWCSGRTTPTSMETLSTRGTFPRCKRPLPHTSAVRCTSRTTVRVPSSPSSPSRCGWIRPGHRELSRRAAQSIVKGECARFLGPCRIA